MFELSIALFYGTMGALFHRCYADRGLVAIAIRAGCGLLSGLMFFALLRLIGSVSTGDRILLSELLWLTCGCLSVGFLGCSGARSVMSRMGSSA